MEKENIEITQLEEEKKEKGASSSRPTEEKHTKSKKEREKNSEVDDFLDDGNAQTAKNEAPDADKPLNIQDLIEKAKQKGTLSNTEIMLALGNSDYDIDQIDKL